MSQENGQAITRDTAEALIAAVNARDFAAVEALPNWHPELEFHSVLATAEGGVFRGIGGVREWAQAVHDTWADFRLAVVDFHQASEDTFVVVCQGSGRARGSGIPLEAQTAQVWTVRDGKVWRNVVYIDPEEAFRVAGVRASD